MAEAEATKKRNELKIKRRDYTGYDDDEFVEGKQGLKRSILAKYDEELNAPQEMVMIRLLFSFVSGIHPLVGFQIGCFGDIEESTTGGRKT